MQIFLFIKSCYFWNAAEYLFISAPALNVMKIHDCHSQKISLIGMHRIYVNTS